MIKIKKTQFSLQAPEAFAQEFPREKITEAFNKLMSRSDLGFTKLTEGHHWQECSAKAKEWSADFTEIVVVGIGGSSLGLSALVQALGSRGKKFHLLDNVDPSQWERFQKEMKNWSQSGFIFISKSGGTLETLSVAQLILQDLKRKHLMIERHCVVIAESGQNALRAWGEDKGCLCIDVPKDVGGRFSVLSSVGMFPSAALGYDIEKFREGAASAIKNRDLVENLVTEYLKSFAREEWISFFWTYSSFLREFGFWLGQLWAESLAKTKDRKGNTAKRISTPLPAVGACDQHSLLQQVMEGTKDKFVTFMIEENQNEKGAVLSGFSFAGFEYLEGKKIGAILQAEAKATEQAIRENGVSTLFLEISSLSEQTMGELFMTYQLVVGTIGEAIDINAFDQPGVERGKVLAKGLLSKDN